MDHLEDWHSFDDTPWSSLPDGCPGRLPIGPEPDALHATCCDQASRQVPRDGQLTIANLTCHKRSLEHGFRRGCSKSRETLTVRCALFTRARRHVIWRYRPPHLRNMCIRKRASDSTTPLSAELGSLCLRTCRGVANWSIPASLRMDVSCSLFAPEWRVRLVLVVPSSFRQSHCKHCCGRLLQLRRSTQESLASISNPCSGLHDG